MERDNEDSDNKRSSGEPRTQIVTHSRYSGPRSPLPSNDRSRVQAREGEALDAANIPNSSIVATTLRKFATRETKPFERSQSVFVVTVEIEIHIT